MPSAAAARARRGRGGARSARICASATKVLAPFVTPGQTLVPDPLLGLAEPPGESFKSGIERMIATPDDELLAEAEFCRARTGHDPWGELERDRRRWLRRYVGAL